MGPTLLGAGLGLDGLNTVLQYQAAENQKNIARQQAQMQLAANQANTNVQDINALRQANAAYDQQLVRSAATGASASSGSFANLSNAIFNTEKNNQFINQANMTSANLNTLYNLKSQEEQLSAMQVGGILKLGAGALNVGTMVANSQFTGGGGKSSMQQSNQSSGFYGVQPSSLSLFDIG